ncbi:MAG: TetR/AcrR family transcriptional regulator [Promethearchaeota archaeon]
MEKPSKKTRARSKEAKDKQWVRIIEEGRKLFLKFGAEGMSMRMLARELGMGSNSASSLYTYVSSKRELWFGIIRHNFQNFEKGMEKIYRDHSGTFKGLLLKVAEFYFQFAMEDTYRYKMMFQTPAPISKNVGPIEQNYESRSVYFLQNIVTQAVKNGEIQEKDVGKLTYFLWGILHGPLTVIETELFGDEQQLPTLGTKEEYIQFLVGKISRIVEIL